MLACLTHLVASEEMTDADRFLWPIPHREVSAALEPVHCRFRVGSLRAAGLLRQTQAILATRPTTTRVDRVAGPSCIRPGAGSFTNESNVGVSANDCSSFKTKPGSSTQGVAESCSMSPVRPVTFRVRAGSAGRKARTSTIDAVMVVRKNVHSHPCQKPPGWATTEPARPRRAISSTSPVPKEMPTMSIPVRFSLTSQSSRLRASPSDVLLSSCAGACPWPGSSRVIISLAWVRAGEIVSQDRRPPPDRGQAGWVFRSLVACEVCSCKGNASQGLRSPAPDVHIVNKVAKNGQSALGSIPDLAKGKFGAIAGRDAGLDTKNIRILLYAPVN